MEDILIRVNRVVWFTYNGTFDKFIEEIDAELRTWLSDIRALPGNRRLKKRHFTLEKRLPFTATKFRMWNKNLIEYHVK